MKFIGIALKKGGRPIRRVALSYKTVAVSLAVSYNRGPGEVDLDLRFEDFANADAKTRRGAARSHESPLSTPFAPVPRGATTFILH